MQERGRKSVARIFQTSCIVVALLATSLTLQAQVAPEKLPNVAAKAFRHADLDIAAVREQVSDLPSVAGEAARGQLNRLGAKVGSAQLDKRSGRPVTLLPEGIALVPGRGNSLSWGELGLMTGNAEARDRVAGDALIGYLEAHQADLGIDMAELAPNVRYASHGDGDLYQFYLPRQIGGIPVEGSFISATIGQGNLTLMTVNRWGDVRPTVSRLSADDAIDAVRNYLAPLNVTGEWAKHELRYVPMANGRGASDVVRGNGYRYELAWVVHVEVAGDQGSWQLYVDQRGNVIKNEDMNAYAEAKGGVLPVTNDGIDPDGVEQPGWPMPFMDVGSTTTDTGGNYGLTGSQTATFFGPYVNMADNCGTDSLTQSGGIDWGTSGGTDCTTPGFGGAGNTHASRSGFYEINRTKEWARAWLPSNTWLMARLTSNMNINNTCNAFWNGSTINFYRSGGGCANTGEIAAVFVHEWGHGMDANDVVGGIASPSGEGIADIYTALRLNTSCIGRNFLSTPCSGNGDPCITCTGVRDIDYEQRQSGNPHDYSWSNANCGGSVHCVGGVYSEAVWSLWKRKLQQAPYSLDNNTAHEIVNRLTFIAAGNTSTWFSGGPPNGGCGGSSGYMNYLAADDDNGNLNDGTPHMTAIWESFNDQEIACGTPTVQDSGCAGTPTQAPNVTTTSGDQQIALSWNAITGASSYEIFRAEGIFQCDFGKVKVGEVTGTSFTDTNLQNGRDYSYVVIPKGSSDACWGNASACDTNQPGQVPCSVDADCDDGAFCNGAETCNAGFCQAGSDPCAANPTWTCDEVADVCVPECTVDADCDDGTFCNGAETCNAGTCQAGSDPCAGQCCDEGTSSCGISNDPQNAVYDAGLGAPVCACGSSCDSTTLLDSRDNLSPAEPNSPNTLDTCTDGSSGSYHSDESNDRIVVTNLSGTGFTEGDTVEIAATVWAWSTGSSDTADFYYTADANSPSWTYIGSVVPPSGGAHTLTQQYTLPAGSLQAVRVNFRYTGSVSSCSGGAYDDADDLVFAVAGAGPICTADADCDDGLYCNGAETCNAGACQAGTAPACDDGLFCNGAETCNEGTDSCDAGTPPNCDDGVSCTVDSCNEGTDSCDNVANDGLCPDDGAFCNGTEFCDVISDCQSTGDPCGAGTTCNESTDVCDPDVCGPKGASCTQDSDCCSNKCRGPAGNMSCKGG